ncbi:MAG TPA: lmo0937 family membrane protein [Chitinophagaceae bacterium]
MIPNIFLISGLILIKVWAIGFFAYHISGVFHILLVIAIVAILAKFFYKKVLIKMKL